MNNNQPGGHPPLQRRRRRSDQISPSSPSYPRRIFDRPSRYSDAFSPATSTPATEDSDSPAQHLNPTLISPLYDHSAALASSTTSSKPRAADHKHLQRSSEEDERPRYRSSDEAVRPATSGIGDQNNSFHGPIRAAHVGYDYGPKSAHLAPYSGQPQYRDRKVLDPPTKLGDNGSSPNLRNYSFSTQSLDRSSPEDLPPVKAPAGKKSRMNLLNPMNLLIRRRQSQNQDTEGVNLSITTLVPALPDFDPSIRGKVVHDFSAPRTRRLYSHNDISSIDSPLRSAYGPGETPVSARMPLSSKSNIAHSPMFKEHFQDDRPSLQPERTGYLHKIHTFNSTADQEETGDVPAFAKRLPFAIPQPGLDLNFDRSDKQKRPTPEKEDVPIPIPAEPSPPPPTPPPKSTPSPKFDVPPAAALPKHMTSTSSRFSFQIGGGGSSAQEKLLEEKHKEHEATRKTNDPAADDEDNFDYDFDADDGFEERIPGVNADYDEDDGFGNDDVPLGNALEARYAPSQNLPFTSGFEEEDGFGDDEIPLGNALEPRHKPAEVQADEPADSTTTTLQRQSLQGFHFTPQSLTFSPTSTNIGSQPTPRDHEGFAIGIADSQTSSHDPNSDFQPKETLIEAEKVSMLGGLGISTAEVHGRRTQQTTRPHGGVFDDEDLYFDDGEFGHLELDPAAAAFDERLFDDDETGKIRDIPADNARKLEAARSAANTTEDSANTLDRFGRLSLNSVTQQGVMGRQPSIASALRPQSHASLLPGETTSGLTETNLAAYHDALAFAANEAAANGRFDRKVSFDQNSDDTSQSPTENSHHGVVSNGSRFSYNYSSAIAEDDGFPFDDDMDDDLMIAEANAEALENDDEGFYGQEFGFYARSRGKDSTEIVNGGYFAERGSNGVKRSHSGKANFQEPSLTPITERSEWSTRNSVVSLQIPGGIPNSAQSMPSPGLGQLRDLDSPSFDEDMSFHALMKLRGRTFGGSSSSLGSSNAGFSASSPRAHGGANPFSYGDLSTSRMASSIQGRMSPVGIPESEEEDESERPTLTQNTPNKNCAKPVMVTSHEDMPSPPLSAGGERRKGHHSRTSSGAESVSYARDTDGGWVLERRRTDEGSGAEVIDREYLGGGRI